GGAIAAARPPLQRGRSQGRPRTSAPGAGIGMIRYALQCERGHAFESWFQNSSAYESQVKRKLVSCPACGSAKGEKAIMAPRIVGKKAAESPENPPAAPAGVVAARAPTPHLMAQARELQAKR